jgi:hypothetical protein
MIWTSTWRRPQSLQENGGVRKSKSFGASALKSLRELIRRTYPANPVAAAPGRSFNEEWIAQALGMTLGVGESFHRPVAPRRHRDLRLLGQAFRGDLVAHAPHCVAIGTDEHDPHLAAKVCEGRVLGYKAPTHPDCVRARRC